MACREHQARRLDSVREELQHENSQQASEISRPSADVWPSKTATGQTTNDKQQTANTTRTTNSKQQTTHNKQQTTINKKQQQETTNNNKQHTNNNKQQTTHCITGCLWSRCPYNWLPVLSLHVQLVTCAVAACITGCLCCRCLYNWLLVLSLPV